MPDINDNDVSEISVLAINRSTGSVQARIKDASTGELLKIIIYPKQ